MPSARRRTGPGCRSRRSCWACRWPRYGGAALDAGFGHIHIQLVPHAAGEEGHLQTAHDAGLVQVAVDGVQGLEGQGTDVAVAQHEVEHGGAGRVLGVLVAAEDDALHGRAHPHGKIEQAGIRQQGTEHHLFDRMQANIGVHDLAGLHEDVHDLHAGGAVGLAGAAQQAAAQLVGHGLGVGDHLMGKIVHQGQLAAGHVGFHHGGAEHGADSLAHAALHAGDDAVVKRHQTLCQFFQVAHGVSP